MSRVAAIDCGTNSIRLLIADITNGNFKEVVREMEIVRLGQGVDQNKSFHPDAIARTLSAVEKFSARISSKGVEKVRFCATSATRDASNREIFTDGVKKILGVDVEVIPGEEEAELSFIGATKELSQKEGPFLVVDIGGGSTEFVYGGEKVSAAKSVNIGCVRMSERHLNTQPPSMAQIAQAIVDIDKVIKLIRGSEDATVAKAGLIKTFKLSDEQATYILDMPLRRLTKMSKLELESEQKELKKIIADLTALLKSDENIRALISTELTAVAKSYATPRRTRIGA
mgnify:CR=1 FL=1